MPDKKNNKIDKKLLDDYPGIIEIINTQTKKRIQELKALKEQLEEQGYDTKNVDKDLEELEQNDKLLTEQVEELKNDRKTEISNDDNNEKDNEENNKTIGWGKKKNIIIAIILLITVIVAGAGSAWVNNNIINKNSAQKELDNIIKNRKDINVSNNQLIDYNRNNDAGTKENKALTNGSDGNESGVFVFTNNDKKDSKKVVDFYLDFSLQPTTDFIMLNNSGLKNLVENGVIDLRIHPVPTGNAYAGYAYETVAQSIVEDSTKTWELIVNLVKTYKALENDQKKNAVEKIVETAEKNGYKNITEDSITNDAEFTNWIYQVSRDSKISNGYTPPMIFLNNKKIDAEDINMNNFDEVQNYIVNHE